jgi:hypothetical protein
MQGAHVTQELPAKAQHVSAKGDEDKGEAAIGLHCIVRYGVPLESKMDSAYRKVMSCAVLQSTMAVLGLSRRHWPIQVMRTCISIRSKLHVRHHDKWTTLIRQLKLMCLPQLFNSTRLAPVQMGSNQLQGTVECIQHCM